jgi:hypothetical protein
MTSNNLFKLFTDPYDLKARVFPGLLVALPLLVPLLWVFGPKNPYLTTLLGLVGSCGALYWLASITRLRGKRLEEKLVAKWGGMPTTLILRHRGTFLDPTTKVRYHAEIRTKLGIVLPSADDEAADPISADTLYIGVTRQLREATRGAKHALLLTENIAYGFHRNMLAMRFIGWGTCALGFLYGLVLAHVVQLKPRTIAWENLADPGVAGGVTFVVAIVISLAWLSTNADAVRRMGYVYAERLFECLQSLPAKRKAK